MAMNFLRFLFCVSPELYVPIGKSGTPLPRLNLTRLLSPGRPSVSLSHMFLSETPCVYMYLKRVCLLNFHLFNLRALGTEPKRLPGKDFFRLSSRNVDVTSKGQGCGQDLISGDTLGGGGSWGSDL